MPDSVPNSPVELLSRMVGFNTVNRINQGVPSVEEELAQYLESVAVARGLETQRLAIETGGFNLLVTRQVDSHSPWIMFESHMDTVTVEGMTVDPFAARIVDGKMFGRGACDTKGTGAAMLWSMSELARENRLGTNTALLFTIDEEVSKTGIRAFAKKQLPDLGWRPAGVIVGEPTQLRLVVANNGVVRWQIRTRGVASHSSDPSRGRSAISAMMKVVSAIESDYIPNLQASHPLVGQAQASVNVIQGGAQINVIPEQCNIWIDRRVVPGEVADDVIPAVESVLENIRRDDPSLEYEMHSVQVDAPLDPELGKPFAQAVGQVLKDNGYSDKCEGVPYGTDASNLANVGIPSVVLGPGNIAQAHTADEFLELEQFDEGIRIYSQLMAQPAKVWDALSTVAGI